MKLAAWAKRNMDPVETPMILGLALMMGAIIARSMLLAALASTVILLTAGANLLATRSPPGEPTQQSKGESGFVPLEAHEHT